MRFNPRAAAVFGAGYTPIDWNVDGQHDFFDNILEFAIYHECIEDENDSENNDFDNDEEDW